MIDELNRKIDEHGKRIDLAEAKNAELCKTLVEITQELEGYADALGRTEAELEKYQRMYEQCSKEREEILEEKDALARLLREKNEVIREYEDGLVAANKRVEEAVATAEANILASIQDGGKSCQWCREAIIKNAGKPTKTPAYLDGLRVGANRKAMGFPVDAYRVHCPYQTSEEGADFFRGVSDGLRSKGGDLCQ